MIASLTRLWIVVSHGDLFLLIFDNSASTKKSQCEGVFCLLGMTQASRTLPSREGSVNESLSHVLKTKNHQTLFSLDIHLLGLPFRARLSGRNRDASAGKPGP
jgi:hypothetical protein